MLAILGMPDIFCQRACTKLIPTFLPNLARLHAKPCFLSVSASHSPGKSRPFEMKITQAFSAEFFSKKS